MSTREERLAAQAKHLEEVQKQFPETDLSAMKAGMDKNVHFEFDVKEALGAETWDKMDEIVQRTLNDQNNADPQAALQEARAFLDGHEKLQEQFDSIFKHVNKTTVALASQVAEQTPQS